MEKNETANQTPYYKSGRVDDPELRRLLQEKVDSGVPLSHIAIAVGVSNGFGLSRFLRGLAKLKSPTANRLRIYLESGQPITRGSTTPIVVERFPVELGLAALNLLKQAGKVEFTLQELYDVVRAASK